MNHAPALLLALPLLAAVTPAPAPRTAADSPRFAVEEGTVLTKVFEQSSNVSLDSFSMSMDGEEMPTDGFGLSMDQGSEERVELTDTYVSMKGDKPAKLTRSFVELSATELSETSSMQGEESQEDDKASDLEGKTVVFTWSEDAGEYELTFEEDGDEDLLDDLEEDTDLRGFLPEDEVSEGDTWQVPGEIFSDLMSPGGDLKLLGEDEDGDDEDGIGEQFKENVTGEITATYKGTREEDGVKVGVIELTGDLTSEAEEDIGEDAPGEGSMAAAIDFEVEGELLWNLAGGHFASLELTASVEMSMDTEMTIQDTHDMSQSMVFSGTMNIRATATAE